MNPHLRVEVGRQANFEYEVPSVEEEEAVWLGRGGFCQMQISDPQLSRRHCQFSYEDGHLYVEDMGSKNGTRVNGELIEGKVELEDGDTITVGGHQLRVVFPVLEPAPMPELNKLGTSDKQREAYEAVAALEGEELAGYELGEIFFNGETSVIFRAKDVKTGRPAAVKMLKPLDEVSIEDKNRFIRGAKNSASLRHPNFVRVLKGGREDEWFYVAMEYVSGRNLREIIEQKGGPLQLGTAVKIMRQMLSALQHAYENDLVFRAVRPENVIIAEGLNVKLTDFELVKPLTGRQEAQVTRVMDGSVRVDPEFAAPELIAYPVVADQKTDVFGAGATLYYLLCGEAPFGRHLPADKASSAFDRRFEPPDAVNPAIPKAVCDVILKSLADYERYNTPQEMLEALEAAAGDQVD